MCKICLKKGRVQSKIYIGSTFEKDIKELEPYAYVYLGIEDRHDREHKNEKEKLKKEYLRRLRLVLGTDLSSKNKIQASGSLAVPALSYSFGIFNWHHKEMQKPDRKMRKLLNIYVHSVQQKSISVILRTSRSGSDVWYRCHHNSSRFSFPIFAHSWCSSVFHSLQSITTLIY